MAIVSLFSSSISRRRAEPQKDVKEAELVDKPGKAERGEKKTERECISMKKKLPEKKAEVAKKRSKPGTSGTNQDEGDGSEIMLRDRLRKLMAD